MSDEPELISIVDNNSSDKNPVLLRIKNNLPEITTRTTTTTSRGDEENVGKLCTSSRLADRISKMQESSENWRTRANASKELSPTAELRTKNRLFVNDNVAGVVGGGGGVSAPLTLPTAASALAPRPKSVFERTNELRSSSEGWRVRVEPSDAVKFRPGGGGGTSVVNSHDNKDNVNNIQPNSVLKPRSNNLNRVNNKGGGSNNSNETATATTTTSSQPETPINSPTLRSFVLPGDQLASITKSSTIDENQQLKPQEIEEEHLVIVNPSSSIESFFSFNNYVAVNDNGNVNGLNGMTSSHIIDDLDDVLPDGEDTRSQLEHVNLNRPRGPGRKPATNKLKPASSLIQQTTTTPSPPPSAPSISTIPQTTTTNTVTSSSIRPELSESARAGLAHKEDVSRLKEVLQKTNNVDVVERLPNFIKDFVAYKSVMLILIKGRFHVQMRLIEPIVDSLNKGDCFILVAPGYLFLIEGFHSNRIERSKSNELAKRLLQTNDLGPNASQRQFVEIKLGANLSNEFVLTQHEKEFWKILGHVEDGRPNVTPGGPEEEDELYEQYVVETNCVYEVSHGSLLPLPDYWGRTPSFRMLHSNKAFVFDFGAEVYLWTGKNVNLSTKKIGIELVKLLVQQGYDFTQCDLNPLAPLAVNSSASLKSDEPRPFWILTCKLSENGETELFKAKFSSWPSSLVLLPISKSFDDSRRTNNNLLIESISPDEDLRDNLNELNVNELYSSSNPPPPNHLILQGRSVGRGGEWTEYIDGIQRHFNVVTHDVCTWQVNSSGVVQVDNAQHFGLFHEDETFVIRWRYAVYAIGRHSAGNMERDPSEFQVVFFLWQGHLCPTTEKTVSALLAIDLNKEKKPQHRIEQGQEPPCFCRLFTSRMIVAQPTSQFHSSPTTRKVRIFTIRGVCAEEAYLWEITPPPHADVSIASACLRSRTSVLFVDSIRRVIFIWHGKWSGEIISKAACRLASRLNDTPREEFGRRNENEQFSIQEIYENQEPVDFWSIIGETVPWKSSLTQQPILSTRTWRLSSSRFDLLALEILDPLRPDLKLVKNSLVSQLTPLPVLQSTLYHAGQPALFIIDAGHCVYLWQGTWPKLNENEQSPSPRLNDNGNGGDSFVDNEQNQNNKEFNEKSTTNHLRFHIEKVAALRSIIAIQKKFSDRILRAELISSGVEPKEFQELFPYWIPDVDARESSILEKRCLEAGEDAQVALNRIENNIQTLAQLIRRPQHEDVNPLRLEKYLSVEDFKKVFGMDKETFQQLPFWKRKQLKMENKLA